MYCNINDKLRLNILAEISNPNVTMENIVSLAINVNNLESLQKDPNNEELRKSFGELFNTVIDANLSQPKVEDDKTPYILTTVKIGTRTRNKKIPIKGKLLNNFLVYDGLLDESVFKIVVPRQEYKDKLIQEKQEAFIDAAIEAAQKLDASSMVSETEHTRIIHSDVNTDIGAKLTGVTLNKNQEDIVFDDMFESSKSLKLSNEGDKFLLSEQQLLKVYFSGKEDLYEKEFKPIIQENLRHVVFGGIFKEGDNVKVEDVNTDVSIIRLNIFKRMLEKTGIAFKVNEDDSVYGQISAIKKTIKANALALIKDGIEDKNKMLYYAYILVNEEYSVTNNNMALINTSVDNKGRITYENINLNITGKRVDFNDGHAGDQNTVFVRSMITSTPRLHRVIRENGIIQGIENIDESVVRVWFGLNKTEDLNTGLRAIENSDFVQDKDNPYLTYNEYNSLTSSEAVAKLDNNRESLVNLFTNKNTKIAEDIRNSLYVFNLSDNKNSYYNPQMKQNYTVLSLYYRENFFAPKVIEFKKDEEIIKGIASKTNEVGYINAALSNNIISKRILKKFETKKGKLTLNHKLIANVVNKVNLSITESLRSTKDNTKITDKVLGKVRLTFEKNTNYPIVSIRLDNGKVFTFPIRTQIKGKTAANQQLSKDLASSKFPILADELSSDMTKLSLGNEVLDIDIAKEILTELNFPDNLMGYKLLEKIEAEPLVGLKNLVANYAFLIAINEAHDFKTTDKISGFLKDVSFYTVPKSQKYSEFKYDFFQYMPRIRSKSIELAEIKEGKDGEAVLYTEYEGGGISAVSLSSSYDREKTINEIRQDKNSVAFANNALVTGEYTYKGHAFYNAIWNPNLEKFTNVNKSSEGDLLKVEIESIFLRSLTNGNNDEVAVKLYSMDRTMQMFDMFDFNNSKVIEFADTKDSKPALDTTKMINDLAKVKRTAINDLQNSIFSDWRDAINKPETINKIVSYFTNNGVSKINKVEAQIMLNELTKRISNIDINDNNRVFHLSNILETFSFRVNNKELTLEFGLVELLGLTPGVSYTKNDNGNVQLKYSLISDVDLWNGLANPNTERMFPSGKLLSYKDNITPSDYIADSMNLFKSQSNNLAFREISKTSLGILNDFTSEHNQGKRFSKRDQKAATNFLMDAYYLRQSMLEEMSTAMDIGTVYQYSKDVSFKKGTGNDVLNSEEGFTFSEFANHKYKDRDNTNRIRDKRTGLLFTRGISLLFDKEQLSGFKLEGVETTLTVNETFLKTMTFTDGNGENNNNDGGVVILPLAAYRRALTVGGSYGYNVDEIGSKDFTLARDTKHGGTYIDKKFTHKMFTLEGIRQTEMNFLRRLNRVVKYAEDGSAVKVLVPKVITEFSDKKNTKVEKFNLSNRSVSVLEEREFKNLDELWMYLGGFDNENILEDVAEVLGLAENKHIRNKYISTITTPSTLKGGAPVVNFDKDVYNEETELFTWDMDMTNHKIVLDAFHEAEKGSKVTMASQSNTAETQGKHTIKEGSNIFNAAASIMDAESKLIDNKIEEALLDMCSDLNSVLPSGTSEEIKHNLVLSIMEVYNEAKTSNKSMLVALLDIHYRNNNEKNGDDKKVETIEYILKYYSKQDLLESIFKKNSSDIIIDVLNSSNINFEGILSSLAQSSIRTSSKKAMNIKVSGENYIVVQGEKYYKYYEVDGQLMSKEEYYNHAPKAKASSIKFNIKSELANAIKGANRIIVPEEFANSPLLTEDKEIILVNDNTTDEDINTIGDVDLVLYSAENSIIFGKIKDKVQSSKMFNLQRDKHTGTNTLFNTLINKEIDIKQNCN